MTIFTYVMTIINACFAAVSVYCAIFCARQTKEQTEIMRKQLEHELEPDFALTTHLDGIQHSIYSVRDVLNNNNNNNTQ